MYMGLCPAEQAHARVLCLLQRGIQPCRRVKREVLVGTICFIHLHGSYYRVHPVMQWQGRITWLLVLQLVAQQAFSHFCCVPLLLAAELLQCHT